MLYGDVNEDGQINNKDYVLLSKHVNGTSLLTGKALENADLDASGEVNNKDLSLMYSVVSSEEYQGILPYRPITDNNSEIYEIKYYSQGQWFGSDHKNYGIGLQITSDIPEWSHHIFKGWNTEEDGTGYDYAPESMYTKDENVSLYAQWEIEKYKITYNGNGNTGGTTDQTECEYNTECTLNANGFVRTGYDFDGWYSAATGGTKYGDRVTLTENITVYAHWKTSSLPDIDEVSNYVIVDEDKVIIPEKIKSTELVLNEGYKADYTLGAGKTESTYVGTGDTLKLYATSNPDNYKDYTVVILGDANGDGIINSGDLYYIQSHLIYKKTLEGVYLLAANANKDNTINSGDLYAVQSYLLGKSTL